MLQNIIPFRSTDDRISSRVRNPIIFLIERVAQGKKNFAIAFSISLSIEEKALGRKGRKVSRGFLGFSIKFSTTKGWRAVVEKRKIDCLRMGGIIKQKRECPSVFKLSLFFFSRGKAVMEFRRSPPLFCRFISRWERRQRGGGGDFTRYNIYNFVIRGD